MLSGPDESASGRSLPTPALEYQREHFTTRFTQSDEYLYIFTSKRPCLTVTLFFIPNRVASYPN
ncbi:hypothetical protein AALO_G00002330 [Alosa alosa]|uniref:Uncharacterized protein n=1 Tax=Alosa alosa TaxID=278164 RepID=A0AAV6HIF2_9TELE|nr:hypothetical protein AALO_G00002330 [Alosa alosa]